MRSYKKYYLDIRFWLLIAFLLRLYGIDNPPIDGAYNWREADVLMVARNFLEVDSNILYPRINIAGEKSGITGMEFPLLNYLIYLLLFFGPYEYFYGRFINLCLSSVAVFFFYRIVHRFVSKELSLFSSLLFIFSLWFSFSRKILPDITSVSLTMIGIYYALVYFYGKEKLQYPKKNESSYLYLTLYIIFTALGILAKIPAALMCTILLLPIFDPKQGLDKKLYFGLASIFLLLPVSFWYFYWVPYLNETYGVSYFFMGKNMEQGIKEVLSLSFFKEASKSIYAYLLGYSGFLLYIWGLFSAFRYKEKKILYLCFLSIGAAAFFMLKAGHSIHHDYYMLWWLPSMCILAAYGLYRIPRQGWAFLFLFVICFENVSARQHQFRIQESTRHLLGLESVLDNVSRRENKIVINSGNNPQAMYFAHRRGWLAYNKNLKDPNFRRKLRKKGCRYILIIKNLWDGDLELNLVQLFEDKNFRVYEL